MSPGVLLLIVAGAPTAAAAISLAARNARVGEFANLAASIAVLAAALPLPFIAAAGSRTYLGSPQGLCAKPRRPAQTKNRGPQPLAPAMRGY